MYILTIEKVVYGGYGLAFHKDKTFFVLNSFPNDVVCVKILYKKKQSYFCQIVNIIKPSKYRTVSRCEKVDVCGACDWVNINYDDQLELKRNYYKEIFSFRDQHLEIEKSPQIDFYRNKSFFPVQCNKNKVHIGMFARNTHVIVEHNTCYLYPPILKNIIEIIREWVIFAKIKPYDEEKQTGFLRYLGFRCSTDLKSILVIIVTKTNRLNFSDQLVSMLTTRFTEIKGIVQNIQPFPNNVILGDNTIVHFGDPFYFDSLNDFKIKIHYKAFFQINKNQALKIYHDILDWIDKDDFVIDAFSGIGSIGLYVAKKARKVLCIEQNLDAVASGIDSAALNQLNNIEFIHDLTENHMYNLLEKESNINVIIFNPPRKGLEKRTIYEVCKSKIKKVIYMSCDPMTLNRDIKLFKENGYDLFFLKGYDMFPHTWHIESLAVFIKM